jgi:hypothetical protein
MELISIISMVFMVIGGATVVFRIVAPLTKNVTDDNILKYLEKFLEVVSLNKDDSKLEIKISGKPSKK